MFKLPFVARCTRPGPGLSQSSPRTAGKDVAASWGNGHRERLPVLRGRLRPAHLHQGRQAHRYRGQSAQPDQRRHALPEGRQRLPACRQSAPRQDTCCTARRTPTTGRHEAARLGDGADRPPRQGSRATPTSRQATRRPATINAVRTSVRSAARRSTTKRTI